MRLNHLHLTVTDVDGAAEFLERYFDLQRLAGNSGLTVLIDETGFVLTLMRSGRSDHVRYPGHFHVGFFVETSSRVDEINGALATDGFTVDAPRQEDHAYTFYVEAPGGFTVEVGA
jgi:lactoylglutathione lyase